MISPRARMLGFRKTAAQGIGVCTASDVARWPMWASSALFDRGMRRRVVAEPPPEAGRPGRAQAAERRERPAPADGPDHHGREEGGQGAADRRGRQQHPLGPAALLVREPSGEDAGHVREGPCLAGTEQEPHPDQRPEARAGAGHRGERRPPERDPRQHPPCAEAISPSPRGDLEQPVRQRERHQDVAALCVRQAEVRLNGIDGRRHADPIEIKDPRQQAEQAQHQEAGTRRTGRWYDGVLLRIEGGDHHGRLRLEDAGPDPGRPVEPAGAGSPLAGRHGRLSARTTHRPRRGMR